MLRTDCSGNASLLRLPPPLLMFRPSSFSLSLSLSLSLSHVLPHLTHSLVGSWGAAGWLSLLAQAMDGMQKAVAKNMEATMDVPVFRVSRKIRTDAFDDMYRQLKPKGVTVRRNCPCNCCNCCNCCNYGD